MSPRLVRDFNEAQQSSRVKHVVAHVPFLVNLASADSKIWHRSVNRLIVEVSRCNELGIPFVVLHPGSCRYLDRESGINRIVRALKAVLHEVDNDSTQILLETMAGQGGFIGSRFEEMARILGEVRDRRLAVCFDTAHVFIAGYDMRGYDGCSTTFREFDEIVGIDHIKVIHLNDSKTRLGSHSDRHAAIGEGELGLRTFHAIVRDMRFRDMPKIIEVPRRNEQSEDGLRLLRRLEAIDEPIPETRVWKDLRSVL